jgi:hypothetical protein
MPDDYGKGSQHPSECRDLKDAQTGARVRQLTANPSINWTRIRVQVSKRGMADRPGA